MPRTNSPNSIQRFVRLLPEMDDWTMQEAAEQGVTQPELIRHALLLYREHRTKLVPREGRPRAVPATQSRMRLVEHEPADKPRRGRPRKAKAEQEICA